MNHIEVDWSNYEPPISIEHYELCEDCAKELNDRIKKFSKGE